MPFHPTHIAHKRRHIALSVGRCISVCSRLWWLIMRQSLFGQTNLSHRIIKFGHMHPGDVNMHSFHHHHWHNNVICISVDLLCRYNSRSINQIHFRGDANHRALKQRATPPTFHPIDTATAHSPRVQHLLNRKPYKHTRPTITLLHRRLDHIRIYTIYSISRISALTRVFANLIWFTLPVSRWRLPHIHFYIIWPQPIRAHTAAILNTYPSMAAHSSRVYRTVNPINPYHADWMYIYVVVDSRRPYRR